MMKEKTKKKFCHTVNMVNMSLTGMMAIIMCSLFAVYIIADRDIKATSEEE
jgi:hypothetical protein